MGNIDSQLSNICNVDNMNKELEQLRTELSMLVLERDNLMLVESKNLESIHLLKFGAIEFKVFEAFCKAMRMKRKAEIIRIKKIYRERIDLNAINSQLDEEFAEYRKELDDRINQMNEALRWCSLDTLSDEEMGELKRLYRKIVKALHPDLHPEVTEAEIRLFENAVIAYKNGDLNMLSVVYEMISGRLIDDQKSEIEISKMFSVEKKRLQKAIAAARKSIDEIKSKYPFTMQEILESEEKSTEYVQQLERTLKEYEKAIEAYREEIEAALR